jgi:hypothetical protein
MLIRDRGRVRLISKAAMIEAVASADCLRSAGVAARAQCNRWDPFNLCLLPHICGHNVVVENWAVRSYPVAAQ